MIAPAPAAPSPFRTAVEASLPRLLHFGVPWGDVAASLATAADPEAWAHALAARAEVYRDAGAAALAAGRHATAAEQFRRAADCFHYAQFKLYGEPEFKRALQERSRECYALLAPLLDPPAVRVHVSRRGGTPLPGWWRGAGAAGPCVVLINGLDSAKEVELHRFAELFLRRGLATLTFDAPGQGEMTGEGSLAEFDAAVREVVDHVRAQGSGPVGVFGVSFGGYLACRAAAVDDRVAAAVSLGGFHDGRILDRLPAPAHEAVRRAYQLSARFPLKRLQPQVTLAPLPAPRTPLFVVHGREDHLVDMDQVDALARWAGGRARVWVMDGAEHVCTNRFGECLPEIGDWMHDTLAAAARAGRVGG